MPTPSSVISKSLPNRNSSELVHPDWYSFTNANYIRAMLIDRNGDLWTGGSGGVVHWNHQTGEYTKYTTEHGLASNNVRAIAQAPDGTLWFGTCRGGISQFDGKQWKTYDDSQKDFPWNCISSIAVASDGTLWFGAYDMLIHYDGSNWTVKNTAVNDVLAVAPDGALWVGGDDDAGLFRYDGKNWQGFSDHLPSRSVTALAFAPDGALWVGTDNRGLAQYKNGIWKTIPLTYPTDPDKLTIVSSIAFQANGNVWVSLSLDTVAGGIMIERESTMDFQKMLNGVLSFDGKTWKVVSTQDGLVDNEIMSMKVDQQNNIWFGSYNHGVSRFDGKTWASFQTQDTLPSNMIENVDISGSGGVWVNHAAGVSHYEKTGWENFLVPDTRQTNLCALRAESDNSVWVGTFDSIAHLENKKWTSYFKADDFKPDDGGSICAITIDSTGTRWIGTDYSGVFFEEQGVWKQPFTLPDTGGIVSLMAHPDGSIWIGTRIDGIYVYSQQKQLTHYSLDSGEKGLISDLITALAVAPDGTVWVGTNEGLSFYKDDQWKIYQAQNMPVEEIYDLAIDKQGFLWVATFVGLYHFDGTQWVIFKSKDGLADNYVKKIVVGSQGEIWLATTSGMSLYLPNK